MKKILMVTILTALFLPAFSQDTVRTQPAQNQQYQQSPQRPKNTSQKRLRINLYTSYVFDDRFEYYQDTYTYYDGTIKGGFQYGVGLDYSLSQKQSIEIFYLRQETTAPTNYQGGLGFGNYHDDFQLNMNYILLGGNNRFVSTDRVDVYAGAFAGMAILNLRNPSNGNEGTAEKFAWGAKLGCDIALSEKIKIKLQAHMTSPVQSVGGGFFFGTGGGGAGLSFYSTVYQFALGGGLVFVP
jgi:hypothetical protein